MRTYELPVDDYRLGVQREHGPGLADEILYPVVEHKATRTVGHLWWKKEVEVWEVDQRFDRYDTKGAKRWLEARLKGGSGEKPRKRESYVWWHRIKGHRVIRGVNLLSPSSVLKCEDCDLIWDRSLL